MKHVASAAFAVLLAAAASSELMARGKQAPAQREPEMCVVPPGAQPLLPAKLLPGMGVTKDFPVTTTSDEARAFFLQGVSQIHSFWFQESERSCTQALEYDPNMAMAHWCIALSAASDYRPAFQLLRETADLQTKVGKGEVELPAREMLAEILLLEGRSAEALQEYELSLRSDPNRFNALLGAAHAAEKLGRAEIATKYYRQLRANAPHASGAAQDLLRAAAIPPPAARSRTGDR